MHPLVDHALALPGALLIRPPDGGAFEIGVQQPRRHRRFANVFVHAGEAWLYFKHDPAARPPGTVPSEIQPRHWAKARVDGAEPWACAAVERAYELVVAAGTRAGQAALARLAGEPNGFRRFHDLAQSLARRDGRVYLMYSDLEDTPELSVAGRPVAVFSWNRLRVQVAGAWTELGVERELEWRAAVAHAIDAV
jgi:hypothetical protein